MTIEELDAIYRQATWLIAKRSGSTAFKALTVGQESLDQVVSEIADLYKLSKSARQTLKSASAGEVHGSISGAVSMAKAAVGLDALAVGGNSSDPAKAAIALVKLGPKAAKAHPILAAASVAYAVGSAGWFAFHARAYNRAAYKLTKATIPASLDEDERAGPINPPTAGPPLIGRLKDLAKRRRGIEPG